MIIIYSSTTDPNGRQSRSGHDQYGNLVREVDLAGQATLYGYSKGLMRSMTDANGNSTQFYYDSLRDLSSKVFPDLGATRLGSMFLLVHRYFMRMIVKG